MTPLSQMSRDERLMLLKFVCAFAWADLRVHEAEKAFVRRLVRRFALDEEDNAQVEQWLAVSPSPGSVNPQQIPYQHREAFVEAARAVIFADGEVDAEERIQLDRLKIALGLAPAPGQ